jgi:acetyl-CoA C-acetyltransferase
MAETQVLESFDGTAKVATYSVVHGRDGRPEWAALVCDVPADGGAAAARCYARLADPEALLLAESEELIGHPVHLTSDGEGRTTARV